MNINNLSRLIHKYIKKLDVKVTKKSIDLEIKRHPFYSSMYALSDLLANWAIPSAAYDLTFDELLEHDIPTPFIAYVSYNEFVIVEEISKNEVVLSSDSLENYSLSSIEFRDQYSGSILIAEADESSGESNYSMKRRDELIDEYKNPIAFSSLVIITMLIIHSYSKRWDNLDWLNASLLFVKLTGLISCIIMTSQSLNKGMSLINRICGNGTVNSCNTILDSSASKVIGGLSWAEIGLFYFAGTLLYMVAFGTEGVQIYEILFLNLISLPFTVYSLFYQLQVAKKWCVLCCSVLIILWMEFAFLIPKTVEGLQFPGMTGWLKFAAIFAIPILIWILIKPYFKLSSEITFLNNDLYKFKYNPDFFEALLAKQEKRVLLPDSQTIILGNADAENTLTLVTNPFCEPCAEVHELFHDWLSTRDGLKIQIVFAINDNDLYLVTHLMSLREHPEPLVRDALASWFRQTQKEHGIWASRYPQVTNRRDEEVVRAHLNWCSSANISGTPTLFYNGYKLPDLYKTEDLKYLIC